MDQESRHCFQTTVLLGSRVRQGFTQGCSLYTDVISYIAQRFQQCIIQTSFPWRWFLNTAYFVLEVYVFVSHLAWDVTIQRTPSCPSFSSIIFLSHKELKRFVFIVYNQSLVSFVAIQSNDCRLSPNRIRQELYEGLNSSYKARQDKSEYQPFIVIREMLGQCSHVLILLDIVCTP